MEAVLDSPRSNTGPDLSDALKGFQAKLWSKPLNTSFKNSGYRTIDPWPNDNKNK